MKYKIGDIVLYGDKSILCEFYPMEVEIMSTRKLGLLGFYYYTRIKERPYGDYIAEWRTKRIYERNIEKFLGRKYKKRDNSKLDNKILGAINLLKESNQLVSIRKIAKLLNMENSLRSIQLSIKRQNLKLKD